MTFTYNDEGIRTSKTVNGVTTNYYLDSSRIVAEETNGNVTVYLYNATGLIGFQYRASTYASTTWDTYFYEKNLQGDIVAIYNSNGVKLLSYSYDAWGNFTKTQHNSPTAVVTNNPFTYRGYYYDKDLELYYLNSRYYDSNTCRFINGDGQLNTTSILGYNMFAYCENNPVMFVDPNGRDPGLGAILSNPFAWKILLGVLAFSSVIIISKYVIAPAVEKAIDKIAESIEEKSKQNHSVYVLEDENKTVQYVGRTTNLEKREKAHNANPFRKELTMVVIASGLNLHEARALEQAGMSYYHTINTLDKKNNQINGVSPKKWEYYKGVALGFLKYGWNMMTNEILYWTGN